MIVTLSISICYVFSYKYCLTRIIHKQLSKPVWTSGLFEFVIFPEKLVLFYPLDSDKACFCGLLV